jgi:hypothetical protein
MKQGRCKIFSNVCTTKSMANEKPLPCGKGFCIFAFTSNIQKKFSECTFPHWGSIALMHSEIGSCSSLGFILNFFNYSFFYSYPGLPRRANMLALSVSVTLDDQRNVYKEKSFLFKSIAIFTAVYTEEIAPEKISGECRTAPSYFCCW